MSIVPNTQAVTESDFIVSVRGKQFVLCDDAELVIGIGDHQFMLSLDGAAKTVYLTDPKTGEKLNLQIRDVIIDDNSVAGRLAVVDKIKDIIDISTTGIGIVDKDDRLNVIEDFHLNRDTLLNTEECEVTGLTPGSLVYRIDVVINTAFTTEIDVQHNIAIYGENNEVLMPAEWSDPNIENCYSTSLNYTIGRNGTLRIVHDLGEMTSGIGVIKFYIARPKS